MSAAPNNVESLDAARLAHIARTINERHQQREARALADAIFIGGELAKVKAALPHGEFTPWVAANCDFSDRTARTYMEAYRQTQNGSASVLPDQPKPASIRQATQPRAVVQPVAAPARLGEREVERRVQAIVDDRLQLERERLRVAEEKAYRKEARFWEKAQGQPIRLTKAEFELIRNCLHPDREADPERKRKAFQLFTDKAKDIDWGKQ